MAERRKNIHERRGLPPERGGRSDLVGTPEGGKKEERWGEISRKFPRSSEKKKKKKKTETVFPRPGGEGKKK